MAIRMAACNQIIGYLDDLLDPTAYDDYGPNGLQVPGTEQIQTVVTGVSANPDLFTRGIAPAELMARVTRARGRRALPRGRPLRDRTFGMQALGERLAERFGIRHVFVDVPNPSRSLPTGPTRSSAPAGPLGRLS
jgi:hypothetical protein